PRPDEVVGLPDQAAVGGRGAMRRVERGRPAGGGNLLPEAVRGRCDGRYGQQRQGGEQGDKAPGRPRRSVGGSALREPQTTHGRLLSEGSSRWTQPACCSYNQEGLGEIHDRALWAVTPARAASSRASST